MLSLPHREGSGGEFFLPCAMVVIIADKCRFGKEKKCSNSLSLSSLALFLGETKRTAWKPGDVLEAKGPATPVEEIVEEIMHLLKLLRSSV